MDFNVVGMKYRGFKPQDVVTGMVLEPEPTNAYDAKAIKVVVGGKHMGYVAKDDCEKVGLYMQLHPVHTCTVVQYFAATVAVFMIAPSQVGAMDLMALPASIITHITGLTSAFKSPIIPPATKPGLPLP